MEREQAWKNAREQGFREQRENGKAATMKKNAKEHGSMGENVKGARSKDTFPKGA